MKYTEYINANHTIAYYILNSIKNNFEEYHKDLFYQQADTMTQADITSRHYSKDVVIKHPTFYFVLNTPLDNKT